MEYIAVYKYSGEPAFRKQKHDVHNSVLFFQKDLYYSSEVLSLSDVFGENCYQKFLSLKVVEGGLLNKSLIKNIIDTKLFILNNIDQIKYLL